MQILRLRLTLASRSSHTDLITSRTTNTKMTKEKKMLEGGKREKVLRTLLYREKGKKTF